MLKFDGVDDYAVLEAGDGSTGKAIGNPNYYGSTRPDKTALDGTNQVVQSSQINKPYMWQEKVSGSDPWDYTGSTSVCKATYTDNTGTGQFVPFGDQAAVTTPT